MHTASMVPHAGLAAAPTLTPSAHPRSASHSTHGLLVASAGRNLAPLVAAARLLASRAGVEPTVLAINEPPPAYLPGIAMDGLPPELYAEQREHLRETIASALTSAGSGAEAWPIEVRDGRIAPAIAEVARARRVGCIILGLGRHAPMDRLFGHETAIQVIRLADRPVLAVAPTFSELPRHAVVAIDFSPASIAAAEAALRMVGPGGRLSLIYVRPGDDVLRRLGDHAIRWMHGERVTMLFERLVAALSAPALVTVESVVLAGEPAHQLLEFVRREGADLIATGRSGLGFLDRMIVGSVATRLLRDSPVSVLAVPKPSAAEVERIERLLAETLVTSEESRWPALLEAFSDRNAGRLTQLEITDPATGAQLQQRGYRFVGAAYDRRDRRLELMFERAPDDTSHLTHTLGGVTSMAVLADPHQLDATLQARHGDGQTLLTFQD